MRLVMFDIDGTLTDTCKADDVCYVEALRVAFGFENVNTDWATYKHTSDAGILGELFEQRCGRQIHVSDGAHFQATFIKLLKAAHEEHPDWYRSIPGAETMIREILAGGYAVSLATGACKPSACFKLDKAGLLKFHLPAAYSDDAAPRTEIMKCSLHRALEHYKQSEFDSIVYVGDGVWDARASRALGYSFIGVGEGNRAKRLFDEGASRVISNYSDFKNFLGMLEQSHVL